MSASSLHRVTLSRNSCVDADQEDNFVLFDRPETPMDWDIVDDHGNDSEEAYQDCDVGSSRGDDHTGKRVETEMEKNNGSWTTCEYCEQCLWNNGSVCCKAQGETWTTGMVTRNNLEDASIYPGVGQATGCDDSPSSAPGANIHEQHEKPHAPEVTKGTATRPWIPIYGMNGECSNAQVIHIDNTDNETTFTEQATVGDKSPSPSRIPRLNKARSHSTIINLSPKPRKRSKTCSDSCFARLRALRRALPPPSGGRATYRRCAGCP